VQNKLFKHAVLRTKMPFTVTIHPSAHQFNVEEGESILDAAMRQYIDLPYGCRGGVCGCCAGYIVKGEVYYDDELIALEDDDINANQQSFFCISKTRGNLEISID